MVGTAVYQLGLISSRSPKKVRALKPGLQQIEAPAASEESTAAMRPWMWKSGMTLRQRSSLERASEARMCRADAVTLTWLKGTILGRDVVPEVCRTSAMSSA